jgi:hypothetical protein
METVEPGLINDKKYLLLFKHSPSSLGMFVLVYPCVYLLYTNYGMILQNLHTL